MKEDVVQLRQLIREMNLDWLDEELDEIISFGKLQSKEIKEGNRKAFRGMEQVPFKDDEQLDIVISALRNYFVVLPKVQEETIVKMREYLKILKISFKEPNGLEFKEIDTNTQKLNDLLNQIKG